MKKLLIMGLPGSGKTTLATALSARLGAVHFNADDVRGNINRDLGFSHADRVEHARRMGWLCDRVTDAGGYAIADLICPTAATRRAFAQERGAFVVWIDRIKEGRYADTNAMFETPHDHHVRVTDQGTPDHWAEIVANLVRPIFDPKKPTALFVGRYQPFHDGHYGLIAEGIRRVGQACIAVRDTAGTNDKNPFSFHDVRARIEDALKMHVGRFVVLHLPNISHVFYGRDVGYAIERIDLDASLHAISATDIRRRMSLS